MIRLRSVLAAALLLGSMFASGALPARAAGLALGEQAVAEAQRHQGAPYLWAATGPRRFDCSGFTLYVFAHLGLSLPHNSGAQYDAVRHIPDSQRQIGDLIFTGSGGRIGHVGIYAGGSTMWASVQSGDVVRRQSFAGRDYLVGRVG